MRIPKRLPLQAFDYYRRYCLYTALLIVVSIILYGIFYTFNICKNVSSRVDSS